MLPQTPASTSGDSGTSGSGNALAFGQLVPGTNLINQLSKLALDAGDKNAQAVVAVYSPPHVRTGNDTGTGSIDDPFSSPTGHVVPTPDCPKKSKASLSKNWRSSSDGSSSPSVGRGSQQRRQDNGLGLMDSAFSAHLFTINRQPEGAQVYYPPSACVFAANLPTHEQDIDILAALTKLFSKYGLVFVKLRRDPMRNNNPFAFCQYTTDADALVALVACHGQNILGRPVRTEMVKAHRTFSIERPFGGPLSRQEVYDVCGIFGKLHLVRVPTRAEKSEHGLIDALIVEFEIYQHGQDALKAYRNHDVYKLKFLHENKHRTPNRVNPHSQIFLDNYATDRRSVFVSGLPIDVQEDEIAELFGACGHVVNVEIHMSESIIDSSQKYVFAFVEFEDHEMAIRAVQDMRNVVLRGKTLKIARKDTDAAKTRGTRRQPVRVAADTPVPMRKQYQHQVSPTVQDAQRAASQIAPAPYVPPYAASVSTFGTSPPTAVSGYGPSYTTPTPVFAAPAPQSGSEAYHLLQSQIYQHNVSMHQENKFHLMVDHNGHYVNNSPPWSGPPAAYGAPAYGTSAYGTSAYGTPAYGNYGYGTTAGIATGSPPGFPIPQAQPQYWPGHPQQQYFPAAQVQPTYYAQQPYPTYSVAHSSEFAPQSEEQHSASPTSIGLAEVGQNEVGQTLSESV